MKIARYVCTHCGRKFEAEEKEVLECPGCFWSTSVKREEDVSAEIPGRSAAAPALKPVLSFKLPAVSWKWVAGAALAAAGLFCVLKAGPSLSRKFTEAVKLKAQTSALPKEEKNVHGKEAAAGNSAASGADAAGLSSADLAILNRRVQIDLDRQVSEEEQKILSNRAAFKSGFSEKLPSQTWTLENFKEMIEQQEKFYQVPLPHSYKSKLYDLFKTKYAQGAEAFKAGNLIQARNLWVESLAFPIYANNPEKHRGVILTMMRPFINDTHTKLCAINEATVEKAMRGKEQAVIEEYGKFFTLLEKKDWPEALVSLSELNKKLNAFSNPTSLTGGPEEYSAGIAQVDRDIQYTLRDLLTVPPPAVSDLEPLRMDAVRKKRVVEGLIPENVKAMQQKYDEAMDALARSDWASAEKTLAAVDLPADLYIDAQDKIRVLKKLLKGNAAGSSAAMTVKRGS